jgi:hypothetical protein
MSVDFNGVHGIVSQKIELLIIGFILTQTLPTARYYLCDSVWMWYERMLTEASAKNVLLRASACFIMNSKKQGSTRSNVCIYYRSIYGQVYVRNSRYILSALQYRNWNGTKTWVNIAFVSTSFWILFLRKIWLFNGVMAPLIRLVARLRLFAEVLFEVLQLFMLHA